MTFKNGILLIIKTEFINIILMKKEHELEISKIQQTIPAKIF